MPAVKLNVEDYIGKTYNKLKVLQFVERRGKKIIVLCECECNNIKEYNLHNVKNGNTKSCGCARVIHARAQAEKNKTHGMTDTRIYMIFKDVISRCYHENDTAYKYYGAKGITVCDEWRDKENGFMSFYNWSMANGYSDELTIDRRENDKGYSPNNCRWITQMEQCRNRGKYKNNSSGATGVDFIKSSGKWRASIKVNYKNIHIGMRDTFEEALAARKQAEHDYWGK